MRQFVTDCEGPISLNDNAFELAGAFIPSGEELFAKLSRYDDYLADIVKKPGYKAGDTLRLIIPFFKAYGLTTSMMEEYSRKHVFLVPRAAAVLKDIYEEMPSFIISTSYAPYIRALCATANFPFENTYCTKIDIDAYQLEPEEKEVIIGFKEEIDALPKIEIPQEAASFDELPEETRRTVKRLQVMFWEEFPAMHAGSLLTSVDPIGGREKARALDDSLLRTGVKLADVMFVGDSITDVQAFEEVKNSDGLAVSFNGNRYAIMAADIALYAENADIIGKVAGAFAEGGKEAVFTLLRSLDQSTMEKINARGAVILSESNIDVVVGRSEAVRKKIRGIAGHLG